MKKYIILSAVLAGIVACSDSSTIAIIDETPLKQLNGTWLKACEVDGASTSSSTTLVLNNGNATTQS